MTNNRDIINPSSIDSRSKQFLESQTSSALNRSDVFEYLKGSYIEKMSNQLNWTKLNGLGITELSMQALNNKIFKLADTSTHTNIYNIQNPDLYVLPGQRVNNNSNKLAKYNLDLGSNIIHSYYSELRQTNLPIYINLDSVDIFFSMLRDELYFNIVNKFMGFCHEKNIEYTNLELTIIKSTVYSYIDSFRFEKVLDLSQNWGITYTNNIAQQGFLTEAANYYADYSKTGLVCNSTGYFGSHFAILNNNTMTVANEAYNNYIYRMYQSNNTVAPSEINHNLNAYIESLYTEASYTQGAAINLPQRLIALGIDIDPQHSMSLYDPSNNLFIERASDFDTELYEKHIGAVTENCPSITNELPFAFDNDLPIDTATFPDLAEYNPNESY